MELTIIGTGTCVPSLERGSPANRLRIGELSVLVDCGPGTLRQMERAKISYRDIDMVFFTHFHPDHISDLPALIHALNWTPGYVRKKDLVLVGPVGLKEFFSSSIRPASGTIRPDSYKIAVKEIAGKMKFGGFEVECTKTIHSLNSIAYRFREGGKTLVITGDCDYDENLVKFSQNADLLLLECSFPNSMKTKGHMTPTECGMMAKSSRAKRLALTHIYPTPYESVMLKDAKKFFGNTVLARDLMKIKI